MTEAFLHQQQSANTLPQKKISVQTLLQVHGCPANQEQRATLSTPWMKSKIIRYLV